ncbi:hypothetical protein H634G_03163 [Metarhizium anisopliae BRIP 53293]|uniref:Uncharacterized protein n=1 Tax=Metarhizium anisopliae BRIP 53293 TaxID=1291518 RepID=A0A0D9PAR6_METAN|nr:hypothetical protein H634G_03163 [Metarhizium anisopliae BRIP 53293]
MPSRKRSAPDQSIDRRRSGRLSASAQKSSYFEGSDTGSNKDEAPVKKQRRLSEKRKSASKQVEEDQYVQETADEHHEDEDEDEDDDEGDDAPRRVEIIPLEKMRDTGGVEYEDHKIHRNTLLFLKDLKANNKRSWLKSHDDEYRRALKDWQSFVEAATLTIIEVDETIPELPVKDVIFRIYRDVRFSKVKTPYKTFNEPLLKKVFFPNVKANASPEAVIKVFVQKNQENALKKRPMGYEVTHRDIELLKLRNYTIGVKIDADMLAKDTAQQKIQEIMRGLFGFVSFLNSIIMPDPAIDGDDSSDDEDEEEGEEGEEDEAEDEE